MSDQAPDCPHDDPDVLSWRLPEPYAPGIAEPYCLENGWWCARCGAHVGYRPDWDRRWLEVKVQCLLLELTERGFLYLSNGTEAEIVADNVVRRLEGTGAYDQLSILRAILSEENVTGDGWGPLSHARYWADRGAAWLAERARASVPPVLPKAKRA